LDNLRWLCPNCHSQTETYAGKKNKIIRDKKPRQAWNKGKTGYLINHPNRRPSEEILKSLLWSKPSTQIAKDFSVTDKTIEKWAKYYGLEKPPRGYWSKIKMAITEGSD